MIRLMTELHSPTIMRIFQSLIASVLAIAAGVRATLPPGAPQSVIEGGPAIQHLWVQARGGLFMNVLPPQFQQHQNEWTNFLRSHGKGIVDTFYE